MKHTFLIAALAMAQAAWGSDSRATSGIRTEPEAQASSKRTNSMATKIRLRIKDRVLAATFGRQQDGSRFCFSASDDSDDE
jgi:hypothetical protein